MEAKDVDFAVRAHADHDQQHASSPLLSGRLKPTARPPSGPLTRLTSVSVPPGHSFDSRSCTRFAMLRL